MPKNSARRLAAAAAEGSSLVYPQNLFLVARGVVMPDCSRATVLANILEPEWHSGKYCLNTHTPVLWQISSGRDPVSWSYDQPTVNVSL